jgi:DNA repair exonuclease SbcCD nuclease subunit
MKTDADIRILVVHQIFDTVIVGPQHYIFKNGDDVVRRSDIPVAFKYIAAGHVHPHQYLYNPGAPRNQICYAGSIDRVSFMERDEDKGYIIGSIMDTEIKTRFVHLPVRPMCLVEWHSDDLHVQDIKSRIDALFHNLQSRSICRIKISGAEKDVDRIVIHTRKVLSKYPDSPEIKVMVPRSKTAI